MRNETHLPLLSDSQGRTNEEMEVRGEMTLAAYCVLAVLAVFAAAAYLIYR